MNMHDFIKYKRFKHRECQKMPAGWGKVAWDSYTKYQKKAVKEIKPSFYTLMVDIFQGIYAKDRSYIDKAEELVKENMKKSDILCLTGSALCAIDYHL